MHLCTTDALVYHWCTCVSLVHLCVTGALVYHWCTCVSLVHLCVTGALVYRWCTCVPLMHLCTTGTLAPLTSTILFLTYEVPEQHTGLLHIFLPIYHPRCRQYRTLTKMISFMYHNFLNNQS